MCFPAAFWDATRAFMLLSVLGCFAGVILGITASKRVQSRRVRTGGIALLLSGEDSDYNIHSLQKTHGKSFKLGIYQSFRHWYWDVRFDGSVHCVGWQWWCHCCLCFLQDFLHSWLWRFTPGWPSTSSASATSTGGSRGPIFWDGSASYWLWQQVNINILRKQSAF